MKKTLRIPLILSAIFLFTFVVLGKNLSYPLMSYDEAWYAAIAREITIHGNVFFQQFNGTHYYDHPPVGFWMMAISMWLFGNNEVAVRLPSLISGGLSLVFLYLLARKRSNTWFGMSAVIMLASSLWFTYRIRSGNLDAPLVCFFLATYYFAESWFHNKHSRISAVGMILSLALLLLIKTLVGFGIFPALAVSYLLAPRKTRPSIVMVVVAFVGVGIIWYPWYWFNTKLHLNFLHYHFIGIGTREGVHNVTWKHIEQTLLYLRSGMGKWYYPALLSTLFSVPLVLVRRFNRSLLVSDFVLMLSIGIPFFRSPKTEVWHLIPLYAPLFLLVTTAAWTLSQAFLKWRAAKYASIVVFIGIVGLGLQQTNAVMNLLSQNAGITEADIAKKAVNVEGPIYLNGPFLPAFVYYSDQQFVVPLQLKPNSYEIMTKLLLNPHFTSTIVTPRGDTALFDRDTIPYRVLAENNDYVIIVSSSKKESQ